MVPKLSKPNLLLAFVTCMVGTLLIYVLLTTARPSSTLSLVVLALGLGCFGTWLKTKHRQVCKYGKTLLRQTMIVEPKSSAVISFSPCSHFENPVLFLHAYGKNHPQVAVEDIWYNGRNVVNDPLPIEYWKHGIAYPGVLKVIQNHGNHVINTMPFKVLVRNMGAHKAVVYAHICAMAHTTWHKD